MALNELPITRKTQLRNRALAFSAAFQDLPSNPPPTILATHFTPSPTIHEHGPSWTQTLLPFLGRDFTGKDDCLEYFTLLGGTLAFEPQADSFPSATEIVVDPEAKGEGDAGDGFGKGNGTVTSVGKGKFKAVKTGKEWEEKFIWVLSGFDEEGRIGRWDIWADPLSAWLAVKGEDPPSQ
ncbi:Hypothetical protein D9617_2g057300 [Elsinoe fawcettii]|nr:Hypothetical protein D9617_2g057300 [Elsinoe fawcettii]